MSNQTRAQSLAVVTAFILLLALTALAYWPGLSGPLVLDDEANLAPLRDFERGILSWSDVVNQNASGPLGRTISMSTFAFDVLTHGFFPRAFKQTNLLLHLLTGGFIFWLCGRLFAATTSPHAWHKALLVTSLWLLSPLLSSTVLYIVQRMAQLSTLFVVVGLLCYTVGRQTQTDRPTVGLALILSTFLVWTPFAAFSKENGLLLPVLALVIEATVFQFSGTRKTVNAIKSIFFVTVLLPAIAAALLVAANPEFIVAGYAHKDFTLTERILTEPRIIVSYISALLFPSGAALGVFHDDYVRSTSLFSPWPTLPAIALCLLVLTSPLLTKKGRHRTFTFGPVFFLIGHSLESSIFPLELYFEHRNYLPALGLYFFLVQLLFQLVENSPRRKSFVIGFSIIPLLFAASTIQRALTWQSQELIIRTNYPHHPNSPRIHSALASLELNAGNVVLAHEHLQKSTKLRPVFATGAALHAQLGACLSNTFQSPAPLRSHHYHPSPYTITALDQFTKQVLVHGCDKRVVDQTIRMLLSWIDRTPNIESYPSAWKLHFDLAQLLHHTGDPDRALVHLSRSASAAPSRLEPGLLAFRYQVQNKMFTEAMTTLKQLKEKDNRTRKDFSEIIEAYDRFMTDWAGTTGTHHEI